ncbi:MAG TPA: cyclohexa-1,5-dienecarbonyl-CoA hydratase [Candidatus Polarisedimenticolia bacterium]|nr:cyclohexa-1,5-dienecarbonyl-CoA hydratase [Candidatus Polarisedimenticolia bacterium]
MSGNPVRLEALEGGSLWRVFLATPKANILDREKVEALSAIYDRARREPSLKAVLLEGDGPHFSFGASVQEHLPEQFTAMLHGFHGLFYRMLDASVVTLAAVRGQCLGGGLELAAFCHRIFAAPSARFGQPEIVLGVFAPAASVLLTERMTRGGAEDLLLSGRTLDAAEAQRLGLVDEVAEDPAHAALDYARQHLLPRSASSLRLAVRAARAAFGRRFRAELAEIERSYCEDLMKTSDAVEGLQAFLEKRPPEWRNA